MDCGGDCSLPCRLPIHKPLFTEGIQCKEHDPDRGGEDAGGYSGLDQALTGGSFFGSWRNLENEIAILQSYTLNYRVIDGDGGAACCLCSCQA